MRLLIILLILIVAPVINADDSPYMATIDIQFADEQQFPLADQISFELITSESVELTKRLAAWGNIKVEIQDENRLLVSMMAQQPAFRGDVKQQYSKDSFVIDLQEASTQGFIEQFQLPANDTYLPEQISSFVSEYIEEPTYVHSFNIASVVAKQRSGDCTEYAVLTTALARAQGLPARVMIGTVILDEGAELGAYGHAWSEVWYQDKWQIIDAAMHGSQAKKHFYLPAAALDKESPGFNMSIFRAVTLLPKQIKNVKSLTL